MNKYFFTTILLGTIFIGCNRPKQITTQSVPEPASVATKLDTSEQYFDESLGISFALPTELEVETSGDQSLLIIPKEKELGQGPANFIYISVIPDDKYQAEGEIYNYNQSYYAKLELLSDLGESVNVTEDESFVKWYTYTFAAKANIAGQETKRFENSSPWEFPNGTTETRYQFQKNGTRYLLGYYTGGDSVKTSALDPRVAQAIVESLQIKTTIER